MSDKKEHKDMARKWMQCFIFVAIVAAILQVINLFFNWDKPDWNIISGSLLCGSIAFVCWIADTIIELLEEIRDSLQ